MHMSKLFPASWFGAVADDDSVQDPYKPSMSPSDVPSADDAADGSTEELDADDDDELDAEQTGLDETDLDEEHPDEVDQAADDSFPASDPPSFNPTTPGEPDRNLPATR
jgi:hypothetical protein